MRYEIIEMDGLYVVFKGERVIAAYETLNDAKEGIKKHEERS